MHFKYNMYIDNQFFFSFAVHFHMVVFENPFSLFNSTFYKSFKLITIY